MGSGGLIEFFRHHGAWAPGVRLFRRIQFRTKAAIISAVFIVPLVLVSVALWGAQMDVIDFAVKERQGVAAMSKVAHFYNELTNARNATRATLGGFDAKADYAAARAHADEALVALEKHLKESGDPLVLQPLTTKLTQAWAATASAPNGVDAQGHTVFGPVVASARELVAKMGDDSNLVLDPDVDSFYVINAMVLTMPKLMEDAGQVWGWSTYAAAKGSLDKKQSSEFGIRAATAGSGASDLRDYIGRAAAYNASIKTSVPLGALDKLEAFRKQAVGAVIDGKDTDAATLYAAGKAAVTDLDGLYDRALPVIDELLAARIGAAQHKLWSLSAVVVVCVAIGIYLFYSFFLVTHGGLREVQKHLEAMTAGDLTTHPRPWGNDEAARLMGSLADMQQSLRGIVGKVRGSSESIVHSTAEISDGAMDLSGRTEQAAANLQQSAAAMDQISSTVQATSDQAQQAAVIARGNATTAERGGEIIGTMVTTMEGIHASSTRIGDIIGVIDGIAFQTNILALNAAVEAARAGEAGRGFAVVASEVRALAQRSAEAAKEIKGLITESVEQVAGGTKIVRDAGTTIGQIVSSANEVNRLLAAIANGANEQATGVSQTAQAVQDLDSMTQQNSALVEETAAAAASLKEQAVRLAEEVSRFRLPA
ncbi:MAG: methyl-accepting chemotaxis protein [Piscinibacter sp.]